MLKRLRRSKFVQDVAPWLTSISVHAVIVIVVALMLRTLVVMSRPPVEEAQTVVPLGQFVTAELPPGISDLTPAPAGPGSPSEPQQADAPQFTPSEQTKLELPDNENVTTTPIGAPDILSRVKLDVGDETSGKQGPRSTHFGPSRGDGSIFGPGRRGNGHGDGPGTGGGGSAGPRSLAYVCDASGSMLDKFAVLREQLDRSIAHLTPVQSFNVIFFRDEKAAAFSTSGLQTGVADHKRRAKQFLEDINPSGTTDPLPALELAFKQRPDLIYLLTDGDFPDNRAVLEFIRRRNADHRVRINTIAFVDRGESYEQVLKAIAAENGGEFRQVGQAELE